METQLRHRYDEILAGYVSAGVSVRQLSGAYTVAANALEQLMTITILCIGAMLVIENPGFTIGMLIASRCSRAGYRSRCCALPGCGRVSAIEHRRASAWRHHERAVRAPRMDFSQEAGARGTDRCGGTFVPLPGRSNVLSQLQRVSAAGAACLREWPFRERQSTLVRLLLGFQLPDEGHVYLDGTDHRHYSVSELRHYFGVVPQETVLFSGTVFENLQWLNPHADLDAIVEACRLAGIHE